MARYVLAIDQGTTSSRALLVDADYRISGIAQHEFKQHFPNSGWVEHDPEEIWETSLAAARTAVANAGGGRNIVGIGISNQRETTVIWERATGRAIYNAIVWQDRRTADQCEALSVAGHGETVRERTGLVLDPYFSATKIAWILDHVAGARQRAENGELAFGTIDSFLLWRLTGGRQHATDITNASRTALLDIRTGKWSDELLAIFNVPRALLPEVKDNACDFGSTDPEIFGGPIRIGGMAGDQQAATIGQACFKPGMLKSTYGTGCFAVLNTGATCIASRNRLLSTVAYQLDGVRTYALEGSIFIAGAAVQWLRDGLKIIAHASDSGPMAAAADANQDVTLVPAFVGLGAPYWDPDCRGALFGLTRNTGPNELARAALQSVCLQTYDLLQAMRGDCPEVSGAVLRADGGMAACNWTMQRLADILDIPVDRPTALETTALGAAYLAGLQAGFYPAPEEFATRWALDRRFEPQMEAPERQRIIARWHDAVRRTLSNGGAMPM
ncbi:Glycerol kinase [Hyphomicrobium sulfonivorans]|uniref:Glycerol kinase n=1 Tax=Hyphomicrobium sulfonivorans TaxID=121290 RepID=A0A109BIP4_HYPSL|nr:glycerol kinase GlpK [Hyphomicrobium sulfonivorans]KWT69215.1 Glycerol kinase [Hyphomicrobium sulfonivorans]